MEIQLVSFGDDAPSGENLEYEKVFEELLLAAQPGEERQAGDEIIPAEPPKDSDVIEKALAVLEKSHDLRAAVHIAGAELRMNGFSGLASVTTYIRGCLEQFWETCHPQLDADDDNDPVMRVNTVLGLADDGIVRAIRNAPLTMSQSFGKISLRDIAVADGEIAPAADAEDVVDSARVSAAFQDTDGDVLQEIFVGASGALEDIKAIDAVFNEKTPGQGPDLGPLIKILGRAASRLAAETGADAEIDDTAEDGETGSDAGAGSKSPASGAITSPQDVQNAIDRITAYYAAYEPSSPVPLVLARAKRLVGADFMTIMKDIAPSGVENVMTVGGITKES